MLTERDMQVLREMIDVAVRARGMEFAYAAVELDRKIRAMLEAPVVAPPLKEG